MNKLLLFFLFAIHFVFEVHATVYKGSATDNSQSLAKRNALIDLQHSIFIIIESESSSVLSNQGGNTFKQSSKVHSNIPLLGAVTECFHTGSEHTCFATLDSEVAGPKYKLAIDSNVEAIEITWREVQGIKSAKSQYLKLKELLSLTEETRRLNYVRTMLSGQDKKIVYSFLPAEIESQLDNLEKDAMSLNLIALKLKESIDYKKIFVKPLTPEGSIEVTPFSTELHYLIRKGLDVVMSESSAHYFLSGDYQLFKDKLYLEFHLSEPTGELVKSEVFRIHVSEANGLEFRESEKLFEHELISKKMKNSNFEIKLKTNKGFRELLFKEDEFVTFYVKANEPVQYFIVGHLVSGQEEFSYLLDLNELEGKKKFVNSLAETNLGKWREIFDGGFTVSSPFGKETLQVFAVSSIDLKTLPDCSYENGYCKLDYTGIEALQAVRDALKQSQNDAAESFIQLKTIGS